MAGMVRLWFEVLGLWWVEALKMVNREIDNWIGWIKVVIELRNGLLMTQNICSSRRDWCQVNDENLQVAWGAAISGTVLGSLEHDFNFYLLHLISVSITNLLIVFRHTDYFLKMVLFLVSGYILHQNILKGTKSMKQFYLEFWYFCNVNNYNRLTS